MDEVITLNFLQRINVIGTSASGKSTFSKALAEILKAPYIEIDKLFWGADWSEPSDEKLFRNLAAELNGERWVLDGNYTRTVPLKWSNVQLVVWLDYSFIRIFGRAIKRALWRTITQIELWEGTGNRESLKKLLSRDSIVLWMIKTFRSNRLKYKEVIDDKNYAHITFVRFSNPREAERFLNQVKQLMETRQ